MKRFLFAAMSLVGMWCGVAYAEPNVMLIIDASGSMKEKVDGRTRIDVAKEAVGKTLSEMPDNANLGLLVYGHRRAKDCTDLELISPIGGEDAKTLAEKIQALNAIGETPIADSLKQAAKSFKAFKGQQNQIILVTDGLEECQGDPCATAQALKDSGLDVVVNIVGFTLGDDKAKQLQCVTDLTGGKYYSAADTAGLASALKAVQEQVKETVIVQESKGPNFNGNLLDPKSGGFLVYAPSLPWDTLAGKNFTGPTYTGEGVWGFKDGKAATFEQIEVLVPEANKYNLKDFEVLASDSYEGPFTSLGEFTVQNVKMQPEGWQGFKFPKTTAHYIKVVFMTDQGGGYIGGNALRLKGELVEDSEALAMPEPSKLPDVLDVKQGGHLVMAPNDVWSNINKDHDKFTGATSAGAGIWGFKDGKAATFNQIEMLVPQAYKYNLKTFEVLAGDDLNGEFQSLGEFEVKNYRFMPTNGWQAFALPETTAHYVKLILKTDQGGGYISGHAVRLRGTIKEGSQAVVLPSVPQGSDLIAASNGGMLLTSTSDEWTKLNQKGNERAVVTAGEGVWAFKDEKPATIKAVQVYVPAADKYNLKDFEVLAGTEGPTGNFTSLGTFSVKNVKRMPDGWQTFEVPETSAKYVKLVTISDQGGGYIAMNGFRVIGSPE